MTLEQACAANPGIGRPMLMKLTGATAYACAKFLGAKKAGRPAREGADKTEKMDGGITLSPATRICDRRPPATVRGKFYGLPKGKAFTVADLSRRWGFSAATIKRHARDEGCFAYIDVTGRDDFEECAMHPETAKSRMKGN